MKKIALILGMLFVANSATFAACEYECVAPYDMNSKFRTVVGAATGFNSITEKKIESVFKKEVLKIASADELDVDLESFSPRDLKNGIFKSMSLKGKNVVINDISLTTLDLKSLCDFNYISTSDGNVVFKEAFPMSFDLTMSQDDLNKTMQNEKYRKIIRDLNTLGKNYAGGLQVSSTKVAIKNSKFYYIIGFDIPFVRNEQKLVIQSDIRVRNGKIDYNNTKIVSGHFSMDLKKIDFIMNYLNPLDFSVNILKNKDAKVTVKDVDIQNNMIVSNGIIVIPKD